jgi:hypothetical protein
MLLPEQAMLGDVQVHGAAPHNGYRLEAVDVERTVRSNSQPRPQGHGALVRTHWYGGALIGLKGFVEADGLEADSQLQERWSDLLRTSRLQRATALAALLGSAPVVFQFIPRGETSWWQYECLEESAPQDSGGRAPWLAWEATYLASRPWAETVEIAERSYDPTVAGSGSGLAFPVEWPLEWTSGAPGDDLLQVENEGNTWAYPQLVITGPAVNPVLTNETTGETIVMMGTTVLAGEELRLDTFTRRVLAPGDVERPDLIDTSQTTWWALAPGINLIRLGGSGFATGQTQLSVLYRHARFF